MHFKEDFILVDTEFTSWEGSQENNWSKKGEYRELVKISAIKVSNKFKILGKLDIFVKPKINPILSRYFSKLTGITNKEIQTSGVEFNKAMKQLEEFCEELKIYSYGNDKEVVQENIKLSPIKREIDIVDRMYNIEPHFKEKGVDVDKYTSGNLYQAFDLKPRKKEEVHNSTWDVYSLYISLKKLESK